MKYLFTLVFIWTMLSNGVGQKAFLDPTFNGSGIWTGDISDFDGITDVKVLPNGKTIVLGSVRYDFISNPVCICLNVDGTLDESFGQSGYVYTGDGINTESPQELVVLADGRLLVSTSLASKSPNFKWTILTQNGQLSSDFGQENFYKNYPYSNSHGIFFKQQPDGKILVAGQPSSKSDVISIVRFQPSGEVDRTFGFDGIAFYGLGELLYKATMKLAEDGSIYMSGMKSTTPRVSFIAKFDKDGILDPDFGTEGVSLALLDGAEFYIDKFEVDVQNNLYAIGEYSDTTGGFSSDPALVKITADGSLDSTYGGEGFSILDRYSRVADLHTHPDGAVIVGGTGTVFSTWHTTRLNPDGMLDEEFGNFGRIDIKSSRNRMD